MNGIRVFILVCAVSLCSADVISRVAGMVESDSSLSGAHLSVELESIDHSGTRNEANVASDGSFEFRFVPGGVYKMRVLNDYGTVLAEQTVNVAQLGPISIRLPRLPSSNEAGGGTVSVQRLQKPVPAKALRAFGEAYRAGQKGKPLEAIAKLQRAIEIFPEYSEARSNLGVQLLRLGRREEAIEQFQTAIAQGPPSAVVHTNMAYALTMDGKLDEAEQEARKALALDSSLTVAHYMLGALLARHKMDDEALRHLRLGADASPRAHLEIAKVLQSTGDRNGAAQELRLYLQSGDGTYKNDAQRWLNTLR